MFYQPIKKYFSCILRIFAVIFLIVPLSQISYAKSVSDEMEKIKVLPESNTVPALNKRHVNGHEYRKHPDKRHHNDADNEGNEDIEDVVEIIVEDQPTLQLPEAFVGQLKEKGITSITLGNSHGQIRLLTVDGQYVNPCLEGNDTKTEKSSFQETAKPCKFEGGIGEVHMLIASSGNQNPCGSCKANNISRSCKKRVNKYGCSSQKKSCETTCL